MVFMGKANRFPADVPFKKSHPVRVCLFVGPARGTWCHFSRSAVVKEFEAAMLMFLTAAHGLAAGATSHETSGAVYLSGLMGIPKHHRVGSVRYL